MSEIIPDYQLDVCGEPCPYPAVAMIEAMTQLKKGEVLEILCDCAQSINAIPVDAVNHGYEVLSIDQAGASLRYVIRK